MLAGLLSSLAPNVIEWPASEVQLRPGYGRRSRPFQVQSRAVKFLSLPKVRTRSRHGSTSGKRETQKGMGGQGEQVWPGLDVQGEKKKEHGQSFRLAGE